MDQSSLLIQNIQHGVLVCEQMTLLSAKFLALLLNLRETSISKTGFLTSRKTASVVDTRLLNSIDLVHSKRL